MRRPSSRVGWDEALRSPTDTCKRWWDFAKPRPTLQELFDSKQRILGDREPPRLVAFRAGAGQACLESVRRCFNRNRTGERRGDAFEAQCVQCRVLAVRFEICLLGVIDAVQQVA